MGIEHKIQLDDGCPPEKTVHRLLMSLPHFSNFDHELELLNFGDSHLPACWVSTEADGFVFCDQLSDRDVAREVFSSLLVAIESSGLGKPIVAEL